MSDEIKTIHVHMKGPSRSKPGGVSVIGHYRVEDDFVVMCKPDGVPIELNGKISDENLEPSQASLASARWRE
jgi:hypothetical protein